MGIKKLGLTLLGGRSFATCGHCQATVTMHSHLSFSHGSSQPCAAHPIPHRAAVKPSITSQFAHRCSGRCRGFSVVVRAASDYYDLLGVSKNADKKEIKQAYRQKARKFHPVRTDDNSVLLHMCTGEYVFTCGDCLQDVNKEAGAEDMFKKIGEAYEVWTQLCTFSFQTLLHPSAFLV